MPQITLQMHNAAGETQEVQRLMAWIQALEIGVTA